MKELMNRELALYIYLALMFIMVATFVIWFLWTGRGNNKKGDQ